MMLFSFRRWGKKKSFFEKMWKKNLNIFQRKRIGTLVHNKSFNEQKTELLRNHCFTSFRPLLSKSQKGMNDKNSTSFFCYTWRTFFSCHHLRTTVENFSRKRIRRETTKFILFSFLAMSWSPQIFANVTYHFVSETTSFLVRDWKQKKVVYRYFSAMQSKLLCCMISSNKFREQLPQTLSFLILCFGEKFEKNRTPIIICRLLNLFPEACSSNLVWKLIQPSPEQMELSTVEIVKNLWFCSERIDFGKIGPPKTKVYTWNFQSGLNFLFLLLISHVSIKSHNNKIVGNFKVFWIC